VLAALLADLLWCLFLIAGLEHVEFRPGMGAANYFAASNIALSHSLLMDTFWAGLLAAAYFLRKRFARGAWILFAVVLSHWLLDSIAHRPDMPLAPGAGRRLGLGLWASLPGSLLIEGGFWVFAIVLYTRATRSKTRVGLVAFWIVIAMLTLAWYSNLTGPPPADPHAAPVVSFVFFSLTVAWAYWMERSRTARTSTALDSTPPNRAVSA
jgi:hypothetical protein